MSAEDPAAEHAGVKPIADDRRHCRNELGRILRVGMDHDDDVRGLTQPITGLLVSAVAFFHLKKMERTPQVLGDRHGVVAALVIDQNDRIHQPLVQDFVVGLPESWPHYTRA